MKVLRHSIGDTLHCVDGRGHKLTTTIESGNQQGVQLSVHKVEHNWGEPVHARGLLFAPPKARDRLEYLLQKATELGVTYLLPIQTARSERKRLNTSRAYNVLFSAMKQSLRSRAPFLYEYQPLDKLYLQTLVDGLFERQLVAHCHDDRPQDLSISQMKGCSTLFAIGPEGDFDETELDLLLSHGYEGIRLGENRLRTETAAVYVLAAHHFAQL